MSTTDILLSIAFMAGATLFTRAFPFIVFAIKKPPQRLLKAASLIPASVMVILVLTSLPLFDGQITSIYSVMQPEIWIPLLSTVLVTALHLLFNRTLLSIIGGTAFYMVLTSLIGL